LWIVTAIDPLNGGSNESRAEPNARQRKADYQELLGWADVSGNPSECPHSAIVPRRAGRGERSCYSIRISDAVSASRPRDTAATITGMEPFVGVLGVASGAFVVWLTVRFMSRHEKWAKWTALAVALYVPGFGPGVGIASRYPAMGHPVAMIYFPLVFAAQEGPAPISAPLNWYADLWRV
jgi:hypothetical protein